MSKTNLINSATFDDNEKELYLQTKYIEYLSDFNSFIKDTIKIKGKITDSITIIVDKNNTNATTQVVQFKFKKDITANDINKIYIKEKKKKEEKKEEIKLNMLMFSNNPNSSFYIPFYHTINKQAPFIFKNNVYDKNKINSKWNKNKKQKGTKTDRKIYF